MIKYVVFENWKSFRHAQLHVDPLTILIGTNASGKSNAIDGLSFLNRTALGHDIQSALSGDPSMPAIRGGLEWAALNQAKKFTLKLAVQGEDARTEYIYSISVEVGLRAQLLEETLTRLKYRPGTMKNPYSIKLFCTDDPKEESLGITARLYNEKQGTPREMNRSASILGQLEHASLRKEIADGVATVLKALQEVFILDPIPSHMRYYSQLSDRLLTDASNLAGVMAALPPDRKAEVEATLTKYATRLPEGDVGKVWSETVDRFKRDAMLYCEELWAADTPPMVMDARGMSDGTLRFLAILVALLTRPKGSQLIVEEVDNALHPSRAGVLVELLRQVGTQRNLDLLVTTHNEALLNCLGPEMVPFVVVAHRDSTTGESKLTLLEEIENLPKLMASGPLGKITTDGSIERSLSTRWRPYRAEGSDY